MNRDVVEGNPTSLESSARFFDPLEPPALMDLSHLHMNDLGLTPSSPGFQLQGHTSQDEEQNCFEESVDIAGGRDGIDQSDKTDSNPPVLLQTNNAQANLSDDTNEDLYDPLFDSTIPELDSVFSRKRTAEELDEFPPEKRQHLESPDETPSLTTDSTHESPSFFDTFDSLFGRGFDLPLVLPDDPLPDFEEIPPPPPGESLISESTKERFSLNEQDFMTNTTREVLRVSRNIEYASPYPVSGGPLGYLPSAPGIHVKCVAMGEEQKDRQVLSLRAKVGQLIRDRDHYKKSLLSYATMDGTGKTPEQLLRAENAMLRRVSSRHQARVDEYKKEATDWKNKLHVLGVYYNNLLYEVGVEKRIPSIVPVPEGYKPPRLSNSFQKQMAGQYSFHNGNDAPAQLPSPQTPVQFLQPTIAGGNNRNMALQQQPQAVMIDLTEDEPPVPTPPTPPGPPSGEAECTMTLQSLRSKNYDWLQAGHNTSVLRSHQSPSVNDDELARMMEEEMSRA
ncbi:hypothetical protein BDW59DRAFT_139572 [Aspergillus cavernicola]|uniref:BZIP domain-containing protein n=1 Tax=Aspergillus cavernicola TaxID=176166 RepID=A0ABR4IW74_9EURO